VAAWKGCFVVSLLIRWVLSAVALVIIAKLVPGIHVTFASALGAAIVLGLLNALLRPVFVILTLPLTLITFGLFIFVINAILFAIAAWLIPGFTVHGFRAALVGSIL
jgi:putative membrane protein